MNTKIGSLKETIDSWIKDIELIQPNETIRVVSGEVFYKLVRELKKPFLDAISKNVKIKIIAGPIISVDDKNGSNMILELADNNSLELWVSPFRQQYHYRIIGNQFVYKENYHYPLSEDRNGEYIRDIFTISRYIYEFENLIQSLSMKQYFNREMVITKTDNEIHELRDRWGKNYDFRISELIK